MRSRRVTPLKASGMSFDNRSIPHGGAQPVFPASVNSDRRLRLQRPRPGLDDTLVPRLEGRRSMKRLEVIHVGQFGEHAGGIAQVVNVYLRWSTENLCVNGWRTMRYKRDPLMLVFASMCAARIVLGRRRQNRLLVFHLSQKGSFIREGGLLVLARFLRWQCVAQIHGSGYVAFARQHPILVKFVLKSAHAIYVLSIQSLTAIQDSLPEATRIVLLRNIVSIPKRQTKENLIIFGGALGVRKGVDALVTAWKMAAATLPEWTLYLVGPADRGFYVASVDRLQVTGSLPHDEVQALLGRARVAILPSRAEALPMFLLEAMANAAVPIGSDVGGVKNLISRTGALVDPDDPREMAKVITATCLDPYLQDRGDASRDLIRQRYSVGACREKLFENWRLDAGSR